MSFNIHPSQLDPRKIPIVSREDALMRQRRATKSFNEAIVDQVDADIFDRTLRKALDSKSIDKIRLLLNIDEEAAKKMIAETPVKVLLAHANSLKGPYEAANDHLIRLFMAAALKEMPEELCTSILPKQKEELINAFKLTNQNLSQIQEVISSIKAGKLTILSVGFIRHSVSIVFCNGYMAICNRGAGLLQGRKTVDAFKINPDLMTEELIREGFKLKSEAKELFMTKIYQVLPALLSPTNKQVKDKVCEQLESLSAKMQKADTCSYASQKLALRVACAMQHITGASLAKTHVQSAYQFSKNFSTHARLDSLNMAYSTSMNDVMTETAFAKTMKHLKKASRVPLNRYYKFVEEKRRSGSWFWKGIHMIRLAGQLMTLSFPRALSY